jgi:hypothetical protein
MIIIARRSNPCGAFGMKYRRLLCRRELKEYLVSQHGLDVSFEQLASWAIKGGSPPFRLLAGRVGKAVYGTDDIDRWADAYLGPKVQRVAEHPAHQREAAA